MRLAISNIAWDVNEDDAITTLLHRYQVDAIDIAPSKYFSDFNTVGDAAIAEVRATWAGRGIEITGMQALMFGTTGLNLFGTAEMQSAMLQHLAAVSRIGARLGATRLVFGAPKNRDRTGLSDVDADDKACKFFHCLGDIAQQAGVMFCLEANPASYGCNFMTHTDAAARIVARVAHPAIRLQLDSGTIAVNQENIVELMQQYAGLIGHAHASEPDLLTLGDGATRHDLIAAALCKYLPQQLVTIEMLAAKNESHIIAVERAVQLAVHYYRGTEGYAE